MIGAEKHKILFLGDTQVGKTNIVNRWIFGRFEIDYLTTIGVDFFSKTFEFNNKKVLLQIWDTAGQERFLSLLPTYLRDCSVIVVVVDVTNRMTLENCDKWFRMASTENQDAKIVLVANKIEELDARAWTFDETHARPPVKWTSPIQNTIQVHVIERVHFVRRSRPL
jgi:Ras-related protein Rab-6A